MATLNLETITSYWYDIAMINMWLEIFQSPSLKESNWCFCGTWGCGSLVNMVVVLDLMMVLRVFSKFNASVIPSQEKTNCSVLWVENFSDLVGMWEGFFLFSFNFFKEDWNNLKSEYCRKKVKSPRSWWCSGTWAVVLLIVTNVLLLGNSSEIILPCE